MTWTITPVFAGKDDAGYDPPRIMPLPIPQPQAEMKWRHCTLDPPMAGSNYLILELLDSGAWRHTVDHYGFEEEYTFEVWDVWT